MIVSRVLKTISPFMSVARSAYKFKKTCYKARSASTPIWAIIEKGQNIVIDCILTPLLKFPLLCVSLVSFNDADRVTKNPNFFVEAIECGTNIVKG